MSSPVRVAVVGLGWAGRSIWLSRLVAHPAFEVTAVVDPSPIAQEIAAETGAGVLALADIDELTPGLADLAIVAVPNHLHSKVACRLLSRGIPVFLEKPVCLNSAEADELAAAERDGGAVLLAGSAARYRADVMALREAAGGLGPIRHIDVSWVRARGVPDAGGWFTQSRLSGGGALVDLGWHLMDTVSPLLGRAEYEEVVGSVSGDFIAAASHGASWRHEDAPPSSSGGDVEDTARGFLVTGDGVSVSLRASWASHEALDSTVLKVEGGSGTATLRCTFGFSPNRAVGAELSLTRAGETVPIPFDEEPIGAEYDRQLDALPALLADPEARGRAVEDTRRTIAVIERIYTSARRGQRVLSSAR
ncbi:Gfo/Idh/MocA family oxidoreductase [Streptomyces sp. APSN-46.1]|uniref:Gfo/Idh/MocA family protein n=1 Tax=Streptomyces sp. APSN-46.1 TaxID=2929049 RepID=UPI001FB46165|nr:Gfo/Idh/MocA family oxidoreductase [Streptomyces sp. APSN-46.1]MCJ1678339.1 Gfo/Idh/MocA family oxidoreductase [Streptomyces sp. APSN-46.1]